MVKKTAKKDEHKNETSEIKSALSELFDLPEELILDLPRITLIGDIRLEIENHKGIVDYTADGIKVRVNNGFLWGKGDEMVLRNISSDEIILEGKITQIGIYLDGTESE